MEVFIFLVVVVTLMTICLVLSRRVQARRQAQEDEYLAWLAERGFKPKEKR